MAAKAIWLFDLNDLNPRGKDVGGDLIDWLKGSYYFEKAPESPTELDPESKGLNFERGRFQVKEEIYITVDLQVFSDGLVANSRSSTQDTERFIEDVLRNMVTEFSLAYDPAIIRSKMHRSELTVVLDKDISMLNPKLQSFADKISALCGNQIPPFRPTKIGFTTDIFRSIWKVSDFYIEPKVGFSLDDRKYFSRAPVHTEQHLELLQEFESILAGG